MRKVQDVVAYTSGQVRLWTHLMFKVKYCHRVFDYEQVKNRCAEILEEVAHNHKMSIDVMGFDGDHLHMIADIGLHSAPQAVKLFKLQHLKTLKGENPCCTLPHKQSNCSREQQQESCCKSSLQ